MPAFKKKQPQAVAEVHLSPHHGHPQNAWLSNEDIHGYAIYKLPPGVEFSHSKIALRGVISASVDESVGRVQRELRDEKLPFLGVSLDTTTRPEYKQQDGVVKVPFRFNLQLVKDQMKYCVVKDLPPSVNSQDDAFNWSGLRKNTVDAEYDVTYKITASVFSKKGLITSTKKDIPVLPVSQAQPPLSPSDFPGEYFFAASQQQQTKKSFTKAPTYRIEVAGEEPEAIVLDPSERSSGSTKVPFVIKALPRSSTTFDEASLPQQCQLKARLVTRTLITPDLVNEEAVPTMDEAKYGVNSSLKVHKSDEQICDLSIPEWQHYTPNSTEQFSLSKFSFHFNLPKDKLLAPTFFTPLLSRRYAIEITVNFPGVSSPSLKLALPLQVVYETEEDERKNSDDGKSSDDEYHDARE